MHLLSEKTNSCSYHRSRIVHNAHRKHCVLRNKTLCSNIQTITVFSSSDNLPLLEEDQSHIYGTQMTQHCK